MLRVTRRVNSINEGPFLPDKSAKEFPLKKLSTLQTILTQSYESERSLRRFSSQLSGALNTSLASVLGELETVLSQNPSVDLAKSLEAAIAATEKALFLSRNLRYFSSGVGIERHSVDISELFFQALSQVEPQFQNKKAELEVKVETGLMAWVDAIAMEQAFVNLLETLLQETPWEGVVAIEFLQTPLSNLQLHLSVESKEGGKSDKPSLPLQSLDIEKRAQEMVQALGLQVASVIIEAHSGRLTHLSNSQEGTQYLVHFPSEPKQQKPSYLFKEKRRFQRIWVDFEAQLVTSSGARFQGKVKILSLGGGFAAMSHDALSAFQIDDRVRVEILSDSKSPLVVENARVANLKLQGEHSGVGLEFSELSLKAKNLLAALVKAHAS